MNCQPKLTKVSYTWNLLQNHNFADFITKDGKLPVGILSCFQLQVTQEEPPLEDSLEFAALILFSQVMRLYSEIPTKSKIKARSQCITHVNITVEKHLFLPKRGN